MNKKQYTFFAFFALAMLSFCEKNIAQSLDYRVRFRYETAIFPQNLTDFQKNPGFLKEEIFDGQVVRFVQFNHLPDAAARQRMADAGFKTLDYVSFATWRTAFPIDLDLQKLANWDIRSVMPVDIKWKLSSSLTNRPLGSWAVEGDQVSVIAQVISTMPQAEAARFFKEKKIEIAKIGSQNGIFDLKIPIAEIEKIAAIPFVKWLEIQPRPSTPEDTHGRSMHRSNTINSDGANGLHFDGRDVNVMTRDDGAVGPHIDFQGRITNISTEFGLFSNHGDGTGGILAGNGNLDPTQKGMASGSKIWVVDYAADFLDTTLALCLNENIKVTNTSYSDDCNAGYNTHSQTVDQQLFENSTLMHCFSAGNRGTDNCNYGAGATWGNITGGHKQSKNSIASANLYADLSLEITSSRGPATDGRIKPDLAAHGQNQGSTDSDNSYQVFGGTSAASPGTAGVFAQLFGAYKATHNGTEPSAALIKALMLNTANDLGNTGPDFKYGWGHLNAFRAYNSLKNDQFFINSIDNDGTNQQMLSIPAGISQVKIMLYWADPEGDLSGAKSLVNDLDLVVFDPVGGAKYPYILDASADPDLLDLPATTGEDHLNNMEQVVISNPTAGQYLLQVHGLEVPQGPTRYFLVYEFLKDEIHLTYPIGGEGMVPGETERIHWDAIPGADEFGIEFSADGGTSWTFLGNPSGSQSHFDWPVPETVSGNCFFRITRNSAVGKNLLPFSIIGQPDTILVQKVCPDFTEISWPKVAGAVKYDVFMLGQSTMDSIGTTVDTFFNILTQNPTAKKWLSVRAVGQNGPAGRRIVAVQTDGGGLINCPQNRDLRLVELVEPAGAELVFCTATMQPVVVKISNDGLETVKNFPITYFYGGNAGVTEVFTDSLVPGQTVVFSFAKKLDLAISQKNKLAVFTELPQESNFFNDSIAIQLNVAVNNGVGIGVKQDFEGANFPPDLWAIENPDGANTWRKIEDVIGINGIPTSAAWINIFDYIDSTQVDDLRTPPFDLTGLANPLLIFDLSYAQYTDPIYNDCMKITAYPDCGNGAPVKIWHKCGEDLSTVAPQSGSFEPNGASDWQQVLIDISAFSGQKTVFRFSLENGYGNNIYLDNIGILNELIVPPMANFTASADTICRGDTVTYTSQSSGTNIAYNWAFGAGAQPSTALTAGPHKVKYPTAGTKTVNFVVKNGLGESTESKTLFVRSAPASNFSTAINQNTVTFTNTTTSGGTYFWEFGDGTTSTEQNPIHEYAAPGVFQVNLTSTNNCGTNLKSKSVNIQTISAIEPTENGPVCRIQPNPNEGAFLLGFQKISTDEKLRITIFDNTGRAVRQSEIWVNQSSMSYPMTELDLPKGFYQVGIEGSDWRRMVKLVVQ